MPRIISYTPAWLSRPSPGFRLFDAPSQLSGQGREKDVGSVGDSREPSEYIGPNKTIARRGTEVFVAVGKQIRWSDLPTLKDQWDVQQETPSKKTNSSVNRSTAQAKDEGPEDGSYRILKVGESEQIRQLSVSPNGQLLAIATSHTVRITVIPDSSHLNADSGKPISPRTFMIGPTTHVLSQNPIASVLWHPLGERGSCLITVTTDAIVRVWEFDVRNRQSASVPGLEVDLKKLVVGSSEEEDFSPTGIGKNKIFSSDTLGLEVSSACFGGTGSSEESPWSAMTLWFAMSGGDIYALCPFLPSRWQPSSTQLPALSTAIVAKAASLPGGTTDDSAKTRPFDDQYQWITELDSQDPLPIAGERDFSPLVEVYKRPAKPGPVPRLQGPFQIFPEDSDDDLELSDIHVIAAKVNQGDLANDDSDSESDFDDRDGLSASVVCLMTRTGRVYVCLDLKGVEAQWLPRKKPKDTSPPPSDPYLVIHEALDTLQPGEDETFEWPTFSQDVDSRYSFFTTHSRGVYFFSLEPWTENLEKELQNADPVGAPFRLGVIRNGPGTLRERLLSFDQAQHLTPTSVPACLSIQDSDLGYFLLTSLNNQPHAATLDKPYSAFIGDDDASEDIPDMATLALGPTRSAYQAHPAFYAPSTFSKFLDTHVPARHRRMMSSEIRLSTATLDLITEAHRVLSSETHQLGLAVADLFRRCERMLDEFRDQIRRTENLAMRIDGVTGAGDVVDGEKEEGLKGLEERLSRIRARHEGFVGRHDKLKKKIAMEIGSKPLSEREKGWRKEVEGVKVAIETKDEKDGEEGDVEEEESDEASGEPRRRYEEVRHLKSDLVPRAQELAKSTQPPAGDDPDPPPPRQESRRERIEQVMKLLQRESSLVEATQSRWEKLAAVSM